MKITELSIRKPIAISMIIIACLLFGFMGLINLGADLFPKVNIPVVFMSSVYPGASAEEMEKSVAKPIEDAVSGISGVDKVSSYTSEGYVEVVIMFKMSADEKEILINTQKALDSVIDKLPDDASRPTLQKFDQNEEPILTLTISGDKPYEELYDNANTLKDSIERVEGVGNVSVFGGKKREVIVKLDKSKLEFYNLTISQIQGRIQAENLTMPGGTIEQEKQNQIVRIDGEFEDLNDIKSLRIPLEEGYVQLNDIAQVSLDYSEEKEISRANDKSVIGIIIKKQSDANIVDTGTKVKEKIESLKETLEGTEINIVNDSTIFITSSLNETSRNLIEGVITTAIVLMLFLRQWRSLLIVIVAIPTSLVSTFFMMYMFGFTFNILSLMGLALCVGILVDDSVVVLENMHRHLKMGKDPKTAAIDGRNEIGMAAIAITLSDIVVFAPIAFMSGMVGQYFRQFGLTVVCATLFSLFVSFTLTPMMASRMFKNDDGVEKESNFIGKFLDKIGGSVRSMYQLLLRWSLENRYKVLALIITLFIGSVALIPLGYIGTDFMPKGDEGNFNIKIELDPGSNLQSTNEKVKQIEEYIKKIPEIEYYYTRVGIGSQAHKADIFVKLVDKKSRQRSQRDIIDIVREWSKSNMTGVNFNLIEPSMGGGGGDGKPVYVSVTGKKTEVIEDLAKQVEKIVMNTSGTIDISNSLNSGQPQISVKVNRLEAARLGVSVYDISNTVRSSIEGTKPGVFRKDGEDYDIHIKLFDEQVVDINGISSLKVQSNTGELISISQVAELYFDESPTTISREDKQRVVYVSANLKQGYALGGVTGEIQKKLDELSIPLGYEISFDGDQEQMEDSFKSLIQVLILSVALVYMILVILYESFLTPFVRILALPVGVIGAMLMLALTGKTLDMMSMIGLIMLDGLAAKNGTLLIDYTNTLMSRGMGLKEALYEAGTARLKPIFMTSLTMIVGMLPTALSLGDGSEFKSGMAVVLIGGMITSTILSPILLPVAYTLIDDLKRFARKLFRHKEDSIHVEF